MSTTTVVPASGATAVIGQRIRRLEDGRLVRGEGAYVDDLDERGAGHVAFLRSPHAHAAIRSIDVARAAALPGVIAVFTHADLGSAGGPLPVVSPHDDLTHPVSPTPLAAGAVHFVGEPVAMVVAEDRYVAEDAAELIAVDYEELPVVVDLEAAAADGAVLVHASAPGNRAGRSRQRVGDPDAAFAVAPVIVRRRVVVERSAGMPLETRGVMARYDPRTRSLEVWDSTQAPTSIRAGLAGLLGLDEDDVRVVAPDVGGGFGTKVHLFYPEELLVPWAAVRLGRLVKWVEDRAEHFVGSHHERRQIHDVELAAEEDGRIIAIRDHFLHDNGAYSSYGLDVPLVAACQIAGPYRIPHIDVAFDAIYTNTTEVSPYRGCGRPQACMALESTVDALADELGLDRMELRRRNLIASAEFPYVRDGLTFADGKTVVLDSGDYAPALDCVLAALDYDGFAAEQARARADGRLIGLGLACYIEGTGLGPYEGARVRVRPDGRVAVAAGVATQGQSHATTLAQVVAEVLTVPMSSVIVVTGDTAAFANGAGSYASRSAVVAGNAVHRAASTVRAKALRLGAVMLDTPPGEVELREGAVVRLDDGRAVSLAQIAASSNPLLYGFHDADPPPAAAYGDDGPPLPDGEEPGLDAVGYYSPTAATWASGVHGAIVEIDPQTYEVAWRRYVCAHDCGTVLNPTVVEGQVIGGIAQGVGGALYERMAYDERGQLRNASFMEFLMPYATEVPPIEVHHVETRSPLNELGLKGVGEAGAIPPPAVLVSAVRDALKHLGVDVSSAPLSPTELFDRVSARG